MEFRSPDLERQPSAVNSKMKPKTPAATRLLLSPPPPAAATTAATILRNLDSNNDQLERDQFRAARAAAARRKSVVLDRNNNLLEKNSNSNSNSNLLEKNQILELHRNCIKLAAENKINQKNTWDLDLIDHLSDIIKVDDDDAETNFQKASCTLEAGVKIYSLRVDSVHSEAYKVLGGINRAGGDNGANDSATEGGCSGRGASEDDVAKKDTEKKLSPLSTLESSFEALNLKKFDVAFTVDPLYHQTSAQFDEGGAKGLLLNNLGVYGGCRVLFDSMEIPGNNTLSEENGKSKTDLIDLSFARDCIELMMNQMPVKNEISPTLKEIVLQFGEENRRPSEPNLATQDTMENCEEPADDGAGFEEYQGASFDCNFDPDDQTSAADDASTTTTQHFEYNDQDASNHYDINKQEGGDKADILGFLGLAISKKSNAWAGPDHWKYGKAKGVELIPISKSGQEQTTKKSKKKGKEEIVFIDFSRSPEFKALDPFAPCKNQKPLIVSRNDFFGRNTLPEDFHYQPEDLVKTFLLPNVLCLRGRRKQLYNDEEYQSPDFDQENTGNDTSEDYYQFDYNEGVTEEATDLVSQPRKVNKIVVSHDQTSKQVDVHALKETLWVNMQEMAAASDIVVQDNAISFKQVLCSLPAKSHAVPFEYLSPHICFICLLHLANEHGLSIQHVPSLDELFIHMPVDSR